MNLTQLTGAQEEVEAASTAGHFSTLALNEVEQEGFVQSHFLRVAELLEQVSSQSLMQIARQLFHSLVNGRTVYTMGNGGSAATALHLMNDLSVASADTGLGLNLRVVCLNGNMSLFSALANDFGYEQVFARQLESLLQEGDSVIGISASGNSPNCVNAIKYARSCGATTIGLLGFDGGLMKELCDYNIHVRCHDYRAVEDVHLTVAHALSGNLRSRSQECFARMREAGGESPRAFDATATEANVST